MAKDDGQSSQLNLTVVALVALVAIVGLVALVLNTAGLAHISTGAQVASADAAGVDVNVAGQPIRNPDYTAPSLPGGGANCYATAYTRTSVSTTALQQCFTPERLFVCGGTNTWSPIGPRTCTYV